MESTPTPQNNESKIQGGGIAGANVAVISTVIFLIGIPLARFFLAAAIVLGFGVALIIHSIPHRSTGTAWILSATKNS